MAGHAVSTSRIDAPENRRRICEWLDLKESDWPPNYYRLLGLRPGENDPNRIENAVQTRLSKIRSYQLSDAELATDVMNRLAEAYACLSDPQEKLAYDMENRFVPSSKTSRDTVTDDLETQHLPPAKKGAKKQPAKQPAKQPKVVKWTVESAPPPSAPPSASTGDQPNQKTEQNAAALPPPQLIPDAPGDSEDSKRDETPTAVGADPALEAASNSRAAHRGIATMHGLRHRVEVTDRLFKVWKQLGAVFKNPKHKITSDAERTQLAKCFGKAEKLLDLFPSFLGGVGRPGYRIAMLAEDDDPVASLEKMEFLERQALALDWIAGSSVLRAHVQFLKQELQNRAKESIFGRWARLMRSTVREHGRWVKFGVLAAVLVGVAITFVLLFR